MTATLYILRKKEQIRANLDVLRIIEKYGSKNMIGAVDVVQYTELTQNDRGHLKFKKITSLPAIVYNSQVTCGHREIIQFINAIVNPSASSLDKKVDAPEEPKSSRQRILDVIDNMGSGDQNNKIGQSDGDHQISLDDEIDRDSMLNKLRTYENDTYNSGSAPNTHSVDVNKINMIDTEVKKSRNVLPKSNEANLESYHPSRENDPELQKILNMAEYHSYEKSKKSLLGDM